MFLVSVTLGCAENTWTPDGNAYYSFTKNGIEVVDLVDPGKNQTFIGNSELIPSGKSAALNVQSFQVSPTEKVYYFLPILKKYGGIIHVEITGFLTKIVKSSPSWEKI
jgi:hypothetical protein